MFTGIIHGLATVEDIIDIPHLRTITIVPDDPTYFENLSRGASVSISGVCLTVVATDGKSATFEMMGETLQRTLLGKVKIGGRVNVECSSRVGDEVGGHVVSGHVSEVVDIVHIETKGDTQVNTFHTSKELMQYIFSKGFIALDGASLTIVDVDKTHNTFTVWLIPETLERTTFGLKHVGDQVHVEIESQTKVTVDTVHAVLHENGLIKLQQTTSKLKNIGDQVHVEIESQTKATVDTVRAILDDHGLLDGDKSS